MIQHEQHRRLKLLELTLRVPKVRGVKISESTRSFLFENKEGCPKYKRRRTSDNLHEQLPKIGKDHW